MTKPIMMDSKPFNETLDEALTPLHNTEAERRGLAGILFDNGVLDVVEDRVKTPHAFHEGEQLILKGEPIHPKALYDQLQRDFPKGPTNPN